MNSITRATCTISALLLSGGLALAGTTAAHADNANEVPDSYDDSYSMVQGQALTVDAAGGLLANDIATGPSPLAVVESWDFDPTEVVVNPDGSFTYTPQPGFSGVATFQYKAGAGNWWGYARTVTITVAAVAAVPVGQDDYYTTPQDTTLTIAPNGVLANDTGATVVLDAQNIPDGLVPQQDGSFTYTPPAGFVGDVTWSYRISESGGISEGNEILYDWILVTISVTPVASAIPADDVETEVPTLAHTGSRDVSTWLLAPAAALLGLGAAGAFLARRRAQLS